MRNGNHPISDEPANPHAGQERGRPARMSRDLKLAGRLPALLLPPPYSIKLS